MTRRAPAQYDWDAQEFDERLMTKHFTAPRTKKVAFIVAHHMTVKDSTNGAANNKCYDIWQTREASAHYGVDNDYLMQFVWDKNAAWACADTTGNHAGISIEHANSSLGPKWEVSEKTWKNGAKLAAHLHVTHKLGRPKSTGFGTGGTLRTHRSFYATSCPGPFFETIWAKYVAEAQRVYDEITGEHPATCPTCGQPWPDSPPKPPEPEPWFTLGQWSLPGYDEVYGKAHWDQLEPKIVAEIKRIGCTLFGLTEVPGPKVASFAKRLKAIGYKVVVTTDGRTIIAKEHVRVGRTKKVTLAEKGPANDDKQIVMAELFPGDDPVPVILVAGHLEYRTGGQYDNVRVTQAKQEVAEGKAFATECGAPLKNLFFADDENSDTWVLDKAFHLADFEDVFELAASRSGEEFATLSGWSGKYAKGPRNDKVKAHESRKIAAAAIVISAAARKLSDHLPQTVVVYK